MPSPLRLCVRRSAALDGESLGTLVTLRLPSEVECIEEAVELVTRHCLAGQDATTKTRFRLQVILSAECDPVPGRILALARDDNSTD